MNHSASQLAARRVLALLAWFGLLLQLCLSIGLARSSGRSTASGLSLYFWYFTVLSNIFVALVATPPALPRRAQEPWFARRSVAGCAITSILFVCLSYHFLLSELWAPRGLQRAADIDLHYAVPAAALLYWVLSRAGPLPLYAPLVWCSYPAAYFVYALIRGAWTGEYPYPFIDAGTLGYGQVFANSVLLLAVFGALGYAVRGISQRLGRSASPAPTMSLRELLGIETPIIQAPMAGVQGSELAIAVSAVGALGSLPCAMLSIEAMRKEIGAIRAKTNRPFNVNFFCHSEPRTDAARDAAWRRVLEPYYVQYGIDAANTAPGPSRAPFSTATADALEDLRPPVVSFHFGLPSMHLLERVRGWGSKIISSATTGDEARWLEDHGVDAIVAQGLEAGGHRGNFLSQDLTAHSGTFALVPQIARAVRVPVIAAGGIADAAGAAAALSLGADAVQIGTAYLLCPEATTSAVHRAALKTKSAYHTALTNLFSGRPARGILNRLMTELGPINAAVPEFPLAAAVIAPLRAKAEGLGLGDFSPLWCGQNASGCQETPAGPLTLALGALI